MVRKHEAALKERMAAMHDGMLAEILQERVVSSCGRRNPRCVKRKMSSFPTKTWSSLSPCSTGARTAGHLSEQYWG